MRRFLLALPLALACVSFLLIAEAGDERSHYWPSWRGPLHSGVAPHGNPPLHWSETDHVLWKVTLPGPGHATPVTWGNRIYVLSAVQTERAMVPEQPVPAESSSVPHAEAMPSVVPASLHQQQQGQKPTSQQGRGRRRPPRLKPTRVFQFVVSALDRHTGKTLWETVVKEEVPHEPGHITASHASASPVTDGEHIIAFFGSRGLFSLDMQGNIVWEKDLGTMATRNQFGEGSSPALYGDTVVVNWDHEGDSFIAAFDKHTGKELWRNDRDEPTSWSTPLIIEADGRALVVVSATNKVRAYDVKTGEEVWQCSGLGINCIPSPVAADGFLWVMSGYLEAAGMAIRYQGARGELSDSNSVAWRLDSGLSYVSSPLLYDGKLYFLDRFQGMLSCYDLASGKLHYTKQRIEGLGNTYGSLVAAHGHIYIQGRAGESVVVRHGETFELLARNKLDDAFDASPIIVGDTLYLRGHKNLYAIAAQKS